MSVITENPKEKTCQVCGKTLPISNFTKNPGMADGYLNQCKECRNRKLRYKKLMKSDQICLNPELSGFTPKELMTELRARGYTGELVFEEVKIHRIKL